MRGRGMRVRLIVPLLLSFAVLASACGARLTDEQLAAATSGSGEAAANGTGTGSGTSSGTGGGTTGGATGGSAATPGAAATGGGGGDTGGTGEGGGGADAAGCSAQPITEVGVSDTEITLANVA